MKIWMWILIAVAILGAGAFLYFKTRKKITVVATGDNLGLDTSSTTQAISVTPLTNTIATPTAKQPVAATTPVANTAAVAAAQPVTQTNWDDLVKQVSVEVFTPTLQAANISPADVANLAATTYTPLKAQAYTEQEWTYKVADALQLQALGGWPASVALA